MKIDILQSELKAVAQAMAVKDIRHYLNGVCVETNGRDTMLIATDGAMAAALRSSCVGDEITQNPAGYILPDTLVKTIIKAKAPRHSKTPLVSLTFDGNKVTADLPDGTSAAALLVDGRFPDWRRVIPTGDLGETVATSFNPDYLAKAAAAAAAMGVKSPWAYPFKQRGDNVAVMQCMNLIVALMGLRDNAISIPQTIDADLLRIDGIAEEKAAA